MEAKTSKSNSQVKWFNKMNKPENLTIIFKFRNQYQFFKPWTPEKWNHQLINYNPTRTTKFPAQCWSILENNSFQHPLQPSSSHISNELHFWEIIKKSVDNFNANNTLFGDAHIKQRTKIPVIFPWRIEHFPNLERPIMKMGSTTKTTLL